MFNYGVILVLLLYRLIFLPEVPDAAKPTIAILAAPASLSLVSYLHIEPEPSVFLCSVLLGVALLMSALIYLAFPRLLRLPFSPGFSAYTFPTAIGATALYTLAAYLENYPALSGYSGQLRLLGGIELAVAVAVIGYVCLRYLLYFLKAVPCQKSR
jgi:tellurite resistance protein TehA-like permease